MKILTMTELLNNIDKKNNHYKRLDKIREERKRKITKERR